MVRERYDIGKTNEKQMSSDSFERSVAAEAKESVLTRETPSTKRETRLTHSTSWESRSTSRESRWMTQESRSSSRETRPTTYETPSTCLPPERPLKSLTPMTTETSRTTVATQATPSTSANYSTATPLTLFGADAEYDTTLVDNSTTVTLTRVNSEASSLRPSSAVIIEPFVSESSSTVISEPSASENCATFTSEPTESEISPVVTAERTIMAAASLSEGASDFCLKTSCNSLSLSENTTVDPPLNSSRTSPSSLNVASRLLPDGMEGAVPSIATTPVASALAKTATSRHNSCRVIICRDDDDDDADDEDEDGTIVTIPTSQVVGVLAKTARSSDNDPEESKICRDNDDEDDYDDRTILDGWPSQQLQSSSMNQDREYASSSSHPTPAGYVAQVNQSASRNNHILGGRSVGQFQKYGLDKTDKEMEEEINETEEEAEEAEKEEEEDGSEEEPDPRVQLELEKLNRATDAINSMETELENCRSLFRKLLNESTTRLLTLSKKMSESIQKSRPYYEARAVVLLAQQETQQATTRFERANSFHSAAKEMVTLAELGLDQHGNGTFDSSWQETLNHATLKVNEAERDRISSQDYHLASSQAYEAAVRKLKTLEKDLKRSIAKSRPYFDSKAKFDQQLEEEKIRVVKLEENVVEAKKSYAESLRNLEAISEEIHRKRRQREDRAELRLSRRRLGRRGVGVGAEETSPLVARIETPSPSVIAGRLGVGAEEMSTPLARIETPSPSVIAGRLDVGAEETSAPLARIDTPLPALTTLTGVGAEGKSPRSSRTETPLSSRMETPSSSEITVTAGVGQEENSPPTTSIKTPPRLVIAKGSVNNKN